MSHVTTCTAKVPCTACPACVAQTSWLRHPVQVTLDINHELAGQTLNFEVELMALIKVPDSLMPQDVHMVLQNAFRAMLPCVAHCWGRVGASPGYLLAF